MHIAQNGFSRSHTHTHTYIVYLYVMIHEKEIMSLRGVWVGTREEREERENDINIAIILEILPPILF